MGQSLVHKLEKKDRDRHFPESNGGKGIYGVRVFLWQQSLCCESLCGKSFCGKGLSVERVFCGMSVFVVKVF